MHLHSISSLHFISVTYYYFYFTASPPRIQGWEGGCGGEGKRGGGDLLYPSPCLVSSISLFLLLYLFFIFIPAQTIACSISYTSHLSQFFSLLSFSEFLYISLFLPFSVCLFLFFLFISSLFLPPPLLSFPPFQYLLPFALHLSALSPPHSPSPPRLNFRHTKCSSQITSHDVIAP